MIGIRRVDYIRLPKPYPSNCYDKMPDIYTPFATPDKETYAGIDTVYTVARCRAACSDYYFESLCNCVQGVSVAVTVPCNCRYRRTPLPSARTAPVTFSTQPIASVSCPFALSWPARQSVLLNRPCRVIVCPRARRRNMKPRESEVQSRHRFILPCSVSHQRWPSVGYRQLKTINFLDQPNNTVARTFYNKTRDNDLDYITRNYARVQIFLKSMNIQVE
jgi:hypothetical protein